MTPQNSTDAIIQGCMYLVGAGGTIYTWIHDQHIASGIIFCLTVILIITNIVLNLKKIKQFDKSGTTKPEILTKRPRL